MNFEYPPGATPLTNDELSDLIPLFISTQGELNTAEQMNIAKAQTWLLRQKISVEDMLQEKFLRELHQRMYGDVWKWAGKYRRSDKNIGVDWLQISIQLRQLLDDIKFQLAHQTYSYLETIVRFHHRLVWIHPFPNGNGRHARVVVDYLLQQLSGEKLSWGGGNIKNSTVASVIRKRYITALRAADKGDYQPLLAFVLSL